MPLIRRSRSSAACRERVPGAEVVVAAAEDLPFAMERSTPCLATRRQLHARCRGGRARDGPRRAAGGVIASCVWDYAGEMTLLRAFWDAAREIEPGRGRGADEGVVMRWCRAGELAELWRAAGCAPYASASSSCAPPTPTSRTSGRRSRRESALGGLLRLAGRRPARRAARRLPPAARRRRRALRAQRSRVGGGGHRRRMNANRWKEDIVLTEAERSHLERIIYPRALAEAGELDTPRNRSIAENDYWVSSRPEEAATTRRRRR